MVIGNDNEPRNITVERFSGQTMCVYSRLASRYNHYFPVASQFMNCSSFVEAVFYDSIDCTTTGLYSDPNVCRKKTEPYASGEAKKTRISTILNSYFGDGTLRDFEKLVNYTSKAPLKTSDRTWLQLAKENIGTICTVGGICALGAAVVAGKVTGIWGGENEEIKLKKRRKHKRPKNATARKSSNKLGNK
jgi:hypothetical protein